jgi:hypothetical protein
MALAALTGTGGAVVALASWACVPRLQAAMAATTLARSSLAFVRVLGVIRCSSVENNSREIGKRRPTGRVVPEGAAGRRALRRERASGKEETRLADQARGSH